MKLFKTAILTILLYIAIILTLKFLSDETAIKGEVVGKHEDNGKCYVDLQIEIPANDYIGLDIGDEYDFKEIW